VISGALTAAGLGGVFGLASSASASGLSCSIYWTGATSNAWSALGNWSFTDGGAAASRIPNATDYVCMSTAPTRSSATLGANSTIVGINWPQSGSVNPSLTVSAGTLTLGTATTQTASTIYSLDDKSTVTPISGETLAIQNFTFEGILGGPGVTTVAGSTTTTSAANGILGISGLPAKKAHLITQGATTFANQSSYVYFYGGSTWENAGTVTLNDFSDMYNADSTDANQFTNDPGASLNYTAATADDYATVDVAVYNNGAVNLGAHSPLYFGQNNNATQTDTGSFTVGANSTLFLPNTRHENSGTSFGGAGTVDVTGTDTFTSSGVTVSPGKFQFEGTVIVSSGQMLTLANMTSNGGTLQGPGGVTVTGGASVNTMWLNYNGTAATKLALVTKGTTTFTGSTATYLYGGSTWENQGTINLADGGGIYNEDSVDANAFTNDSGATVSYTAMTADTQVHLDLAAFNNGSVTLGAHSPMSFGGGNNATQTDSGTFTVGANSTLFLPGTRHENTGTSFGGAGTVNVQGTDTITASSVTISPGTFQVDGTLVSASGQTTTLANLTSTGGSLQGPGGVTVTGPASIGGLYLNYNGTAATKVPFITKGTTTYTSSAYVYFYGGSTWENQGTINLTDSGGMSNQDALDANQFTNDSGAVLQYTAATADTSAYVGVAAFNNGAVSLGAHSPMYFGDNNSATQTDTGSFTVGANSTLYMPNMRQEGSGASFGGAGTVDVTGTQTITASNVTVNPGKYQLDGTLVVPLNTTATLGNLTTNGAYLEGPGTVSVAGNATINGLYLDPSAAAGKKAHLITNGTTGFGGSNYVYFYGGSTWENAGTVNLATGGGASNQDGLTTNLFTNDLGATVAYNGATATSESDLYVKTTNNGTITSTKGVLGIQTLTNETAGGVLSGTGTYNANGTIGFPVALVNNAATVNIGPSGVVGTYGNSNTSTIGGMTTNSGTFSVNRTLSIPKNYANSGTINVNGVTLTVTTLTQTAGTTTVTTGGTLQGGSLGNGAITINGGTLTGNGSIAGQVSGTGTISPGRSAGPLSIAANYSPGASGTLAIGISGPSQVGTDFGKLAVTGTATLNGTLAIQTQSGYTPPLGTTYTILTGGTVNGTFSSITGANLADRQYRATYNAGSVVLTVVQPPAITSNASTTFTAGSAGSFGVTTTGYPAPALSIGGATLPSGVTFVDNGNGTATLSGTPATGSGGTYPFTITANNTVNPNATQNFTLTVNEAAAVTSNSSTTFTTGSAGTFSVTTRGFPKPSLSNGGATLPSGVTFTDNGNGTATLSGTPAAGTGGTYPMTITAHNGIGSDDAQSYTLTVNQPAAVTSASSTTFKVGTAGSFGVTSTGFPKPGLSIGGATLPSGVTFVDNGNGTATLSGTPAAGTGGTYPFTVTAHNGVGSDGTQNFTLTVDPGVTVASISPNAAGQGAHPTVTITGTGFQSGATVAASGTGVTFSSVSVTDSQHLTASMTVGTAAATGTRNITVTTSTGSGSCTGCLTVNPKPTVTSMAPSAIGQNATGVPVTISGTNFVSGAKISFTGGAGVTGTVTSVSATSISAKVTVKSTAPTGSYTLRVTNPDGGAAACAGCLTVNAAPAVTNLSPSSLEQGATGVAGTITGSGFANGIKAAFSGPGTGVTGTVNTVSGTSIGLTLKVGATTTPGSYKMTLTNTDGGRYICTNCLTVSAGPAITSITPNSATRGQSNLAFTVNGNRFSSDATLKGPAGVTFTNVVVNGAGTQITATMSVTAGAPTGSNKPVTVTNGPIGGYGVGVLNGLTIS